MTRDFLNAALPMFAHADKQPAPFMPSKRTIKHPSSSKASRLLVVLSLLITITLLSRLGLLPPDATRTPAAKGRGQREVNVLLRVETNNERRDVDNLLSDAGMG